MNACTYRSAVTLLALSLVACGGGPDNSTKCGGIVAPQRTVSASPSTVDLDVGGQQQLSAAASTGCASDAPAPVTWQSGAPAIAAVSTTGLVTANAPGTATITASAFNNAAQASVTVTVRRPEVRSVTASDTSIRIRERQTRKLVVTVVTTGNLTRRVTFTSRAPTIASVRVVDSVSAEVTAVAVGSTAIDIVATSDTTRRATVPVVVDPATVASVRIAGLASTDSLLLSSRRTLSVVVRDSANVELRDRVVRWATETPTTLSVTATGELQAIRAGLARVAARVAVGDGTGDRLDTVSVRVYGTLDVAVSPRTGSVEENRNLSLQAAVTATTGIDRALDWESARPAIASVSATGVVTGVSPGTTVIRARSRAVASIADSATVDVIARGVPTTITLVPRLDTLSPRGTRTLQATVRDQRGVVLDGTPVTWRSLNSTLATVSTTGLVTAVALGEARIVATTPRTTSADSLADTTRVLIVDPCSIVRPFAIGASYVGQFDGSSCQNYFNFPLLDQFSISSTAQAYFAITLTPAFRGSLSSLNIGTGFWGEIALANQSLETLVVIRPGSFGFLIAGIAGATGPYTVTTSLTPDPRRSCVLTTATTGVAFQTAVAPNCIQRDIRILPGMPTGQPIRITASAASFPIRIELRAENGTLLTSSVAATSGGTATIALTWQGSFTFMYVRVIGAANQSDLVSVVIER